MCSFPILLCQQEQSFQVFHPLLLHLGLLQYSNRNSVWQTMEATDPPSWAAQLPVLSELTFEDYLGTSLAKCLMSILLSLWFHFLLLNSVLVNLEISLAFLYVSYSLHLQSWEQTYCSCSQMEKPQVCWLNHGPIESIAQDLGCFHSVYQVMCYWKLNFWL